MDARLRQIIKTIKAQLEEEHIRCADEKAINYGWRLVCTDGTAEASLNVYCGKKGPSVVVQGKESALKLRLAALTGRTAAAGAPETLVRPADASSWIGCDEAGKGDVFGPLAAAACLITKDEEATLRRLGVCDSKLLDDGTAAVLSRRIGDLLGDRAAVTVLMPREYNARYEKLRQEQKNLNHLLGRIHAENIRVLLSKYECPCIIVDKFGKDDYVLSALGPAASGRKVIQVPKGERDTAVAAASILARQAFLGGMAALSETYGMTFPKGAYAGISAAVAAFRRRYGDGQLACVGKLHFRNFDFLR